jgi:3-oxoacyl-[acyl-carrier-protein] synthase-3
MTLKRARIIGLGSYLPPTILSNSDLEKLVETSDEWILTRTGMSERRIADKEESTSHLAIHAAQRALENSGIQANAIDLILVATMTPDYLCPSTAALVQAKIGATQAAAMDIQAACTGYLYGLSMAKAFIESGMYKCLHSLIIPAETHVFYLVMVLRLQLFPMRVRGY